MRASLKVNTKPELPPRNTNSGASKSTNANTADQVPPENEEDSESATEQDVENHFPNQPFCLETETGERGAKPESNLILDTEVKLIDEKREKVQQLLRNTTEIREMVTSRELNPDGLDLH